MSLLLPFEIRSVLYDVYMRLGLDIPLAALSLYLCPDIYLEDLVFIMHKQGHKESRRKRKRLTKMDHI